MNDNARKIFDLLGVEPYEWFETKCSDHRHYIDDNLELITTLYSPYIKHIKEPKLLIKLINNPELIIKIPDPNTPNKKKLRDLTEEEFLKWKKDNCNVDSKCSNCTFDYAFCQVITNGFWVKHKDLYSDKFLDQEVEME